MAQDRVPGIENFREPLPEFESHIIYHAGRPLAHLVGEQLPRLEPLSHSRNIQIELNRFHTPTIPRPRRNVKGRGDTLVILFFKSKKIELNLAEFS
jgi:hypothetical protein